MRAERASIPKAEIERASKAAQKRAIETFEFEKAETVALYKACFGEINTDDIFYAARAAGKTIIYPITDTKRKTLRFAEVKNLDEMTPGTWNIPEPPPESKTVGLDKADLVILPGVAFDSRGGRLGMGGGFYDRMLANLPRRVVRMGIAYDFQVIERVPEEENDQRIDCLITESGVLRFPERG